MKDAERLFLAVGGADPELVARSQRKHRPRWPGYCLAAAACLVLVLTLGTVRHLWTVGTVQPVSPGPDTVEPPEQSGPGSPQLVLPEQGGEIGTLRLMSYAPQSQDAADFLIYVNEELFNICEENSLYSIRSKDPLPEYFPECGLDIAHLPETSPDEAVQSAEEALSSRYAEVFREEESAVLPQSLYLRASAGTDWDSEQAELWFVNDGQGGTFVLASRYFLEAEEGLGLRFRDMVSSFQVVSLSETVPDWMRSLYEAADRLFPALLSNDLSGVSDLLTEDASPDTYGENVWESAAIASVDYAPDDDRDPHSATVSVKHRLNLEEGESYNYLTMELIREDGQWRLRWSGIEK